MAAIVGCQYRNKLLPLPLLTVYLNVELQKRESDSCHQRQDYLACLAAELLKRALLDIAE